MVHLATEAASAPIGQAATEDASPVASAAVDLRGFCSDDGSDMRRLLKLPFSHGAFSYATNGAVGIRVSRRDGVPELESPQYGQAMDDWFTPLEAAQFEPVNVTLPDDQEQSTTEPCESCEGRGRDHECPDCKCKCDDCGGSGEEIVVDRISVAALGDIYRLRYLRKILQLPNVEIARLPRGNGHPALFRFEGGVAVLMRLNNKYKHHLQATTVPPDFSATEAPAVPR